MWKKNLIIVLLILIILPTNSFAEEQESPEDVPLASVYGRGGEIQITTSPPKITQAPTTTPPPKTSFSPTTTIPPSTNNDNSSFGKIIGRLFAIGVLFIIFKKIFGKLIFKKKS